jgi:hypothetical protein
MVDYLTSLEYMGTRPIVKSPAIKNNLFDKDFFNEIVSTINDLPIESFDYDRGFGRFLLKSGAANDLVNRMLNNSLEVAREVFGSKTLLPTYGLFSRYKGYRSNLVRHYDTNACTYTLDVCISSKVDWPIFVENVPYSLAPNDALCFYGEDQLHWREEFPEKDNNIVEMAFLHYAEPNHWFFTKPKEFYNEALNIKNSMPGQVM